MSPSAYTPDVPAMTLEALKDVTADLMLTMVRDAAEYYGPSDIMDLDLGNVKMANPASPLSANRVTPFMTG